jgi:hypothetical protein
MAEALVGHRFSILTVGVIIRGREGAFALDGAV